MNWVKHEQLHVVNAKIVFKLECFDSLPLRFCERSAIEQKFALGGRGFATGRGKTNTNVGPYTY